MVFVPPETFSSLRDGPIKLLFLDMVVPMVSRWLGVGGKDSTSQSHSSLLSNERSGSSSTATTARLSDRSGEETVVSIIRKALKEAELCHQKLAVEACLHRYSITRFWPDILTRAASYVFKFFAITLLCGWDLNLNIEAMQTDRPSLDH